MNLPQSILIAATILSTQPAPQDMPVPEPVYKHVAILPQRTDRLAPRIHGQPYTPPPQTTTRSQVPRTHPLDRRRCARVPFTSYSVTY